MVRHYAAAHAPSAFCLNYTEETLSHTSTLCRGSNLDGTGASVQIHGTQKRV